MKFIFFMLILGSLFVGGCQSSIEKKIWENVAEIRQFVVCGESEECFATLMCGLREVDYKIDGYANDLIDFGVITIVFNEDGLKSQQAEFVLFVGTKKYSGELVKNPFDNTLVADIKEIVDQSQNISLEIYIDDTKISSLKLRNVGSEWQIKYEDCVDILLNNYKAQVKSFVNNGKFEGEVYLKIMNAYELSVKDFYYYVSIVGRTGGSISMIVCPETGNVLASNCTIT